jgi:outer membrane protein
MTIRKIRILCLAISLCILIPFTISAAGPLTMEESIDIALQNSLILNIAREGVKGAEAQKREAMTAFLPRLSTYYSYTRLNEEPNFYFPGISGYGPIIPSQNLVAGTINNYNWVIEARQPLFAGGGILANYQAQQIGEQAAQKEQTAKYQDVVQEVKIAYFSLLKAQRIEEAARQSVEMLEGHCDIARNYFRVGMIPKNDLLQAEVELANGKQVVTRAKNVVLLSKARLNTVLKRKISDPVDVVDILTYQPLKQSFEECLDIARQNKPELKISEYKAQQSKKVVQVAQSEYFPAINLTGNYSRFGDNPSVSGSDYQNMESWKIMAVASWNFWEWGKTKFRVDAARSRENQAMDFVKELNDQTAFEIKNAYLVLQEAESQITVSQLVIQQAEENFRISEARYKERVARSTEVLDAQTLLTRAKAEYANALGEYNINYVRLQRAMGVINR